MSYGLGLGVMWHELWVMNYWLGVIQIRVRVRITVTVRVMDYTILC